MSLFVYDEDDVLNNNVPVEIIRENDFYFGGNSIIPDCPEAKEVLSYIENAERVSDTTFISNVNRDWGAVFSDYLSTGCKTALNVIQHPDKCFDLLECGANALWKILTLRNGSVIYYPRQIPIDIADECDIVFKGHNFKSFRDFVGWRHENC